MLKRDSKSPVMVCKWDHRYYQVKIEKSSEQHAVLNLPLARWVLAHKIYCSIVEVVRLEIKSVEFQQRLQSMRNKTIVPYFVLTVNR